MKFYNNLPIFAVTIQNDNEGIDLVSVVECPAVESYFNRFEKVEEPLKCSIIDENERRVIAPIVRCDFPILRVDDEGKYYYVTFSEEVSRKIARKMLRENKQNEYNFNHEEGTKVDGFTIEQLFIKDSKKGVSPIGYEDVAEGSLFGVYTVSNNDLWNKIESGEFNGLSLEGYFWLY